MQKFINDFNSIKKEYITIATWPEYDVQTLLKECDMLVTDYSSVAMDVAYLNKPVVYYQFDYEQFRKWHLEEGYFSYENDGFGPVRYNLKDAIDSVESYAKNNFKLEAKYQKRIDNFFDLRDKKNCERTYLKIKEL